MSSGQEVCARRARDGHMPDVEPYLETEKVDEDFSHGAR